MITFRIPLEKRNTFISLWHYIHNNTTTEEVDNAGLEHHQDKSESLTVIIHDITAFNTEDIQNRLLNGLRDLGKEENFNN